MLRAVSQLQVDARSKLLLRDKVLSALNFPPPIEPWLSFHHIIWQNENKAAFEMLNAAMVTNLSSGFSSTDDKRLQFVFASKSQSLIKSKWVK